MSRRYVYAAAGILALICLVPAAMLAQRAPATTPAWAADPFRLQWERTDGMVMSGAAGYSWYWGPEPRSPAMLERNDEAPGRERLVVYYDKGRMELPVPLASAQSPSLVTFGRLVYEMVTGDVQLGERRFEPGPGARIPVAGDANDPSAPTYVSFARYVTLGGAGSAPRADGGRPGLQIDRAGTLTPRADLAAAYPETAYAAYDDVTGHNVPGVFVRFMQQRGTVQTASGRRSDQIIDSLAVIGRPISEAYWADVVVGGRVQTILVQLFERRVLTYNPANPPRFRVEFGNVGLHYYTWRYASQQPRAGRAEELVSHFERGDQALTGGFWFSFDDRNDGGTSRASSRVVSPGVWDSTRAMRFEYSVTGGGRLGFAELALNLDGPGGPRDLRGVSAIGFWARSDGRNLAVRLGSAITDEPFAATFSAPGEWTWIELPIAGFAQRPGAAAVDRDQALAVATRIGFRPVARPSSGFLEIDNLIFIRGSTVPPPPPAPAVISDFESGSATTPLGTEWFTYDDRPDGGSSVVELAVVPGGGPSGGSALRFRGTLNGRWIERPYGGMGVRLAPNGESTDVCNVQTIRMSVRTDGQAYRLQLNSALIADDSEYGITIVAPAHVWTPLIIPVKLLAPPEQADVVSMNVACTQMESIIITPLDQPEAFQLMVDDVALGR